MRFEMIEKGWHYATVDGKINIKKSYHRVCTVKTVSIVLNKYEAVQQWTIYGLEENHIYSFRTLKEAQQFVEVTLLRELGELQSQYTLSDKSEENMARKQRIMEIRATMGLGNSKPDGRKDRRNPVIKYK